MLPIALDKVGLPDIQQLLDAGFSETKTVDYKLALYPFEKDRSSDGAEIKKEFLKDVSSFANTVGGDLIIGIKAKKGVPTEIVGIEHSNPDNLKNQLDQIIQTGLDPRVIWNIHTVSVAPSRFVIVIRIPQSATRPHRIVCNNEFGQFWARNSQGTYPMDVMELRQAFLLSATAEENVRSFRRNRSSGIGKGETPITLENDAKFIIHLIPHASFTTHVRFNADVLSRTTLLLPVLAGASFSSFRHNLDGIVTYDGDARSPAIGYTQLFRNGAIEIVRNGATLEPRGIPNAPRMIAIDFPGQLLNVMPRYLEALRTLGMSGPAWCMLTLVGVKNAMIYNQHAFTQHVIDRDLLLIPEVEIGIGNADRRRMFDEMRPMFDMLWNAGGHVRCPLWDNCNP